MGLCSNRHGPEGCLGYVVLEREPKFFRKQEGKLEMKKKTDKNKTPTMSFSICWIKEL